MNAVIERDGEKYFNPAVVELIKRTTEVTDYLVLSGHPKEKWCITAGDGSAGILDASHCRNWLRAHLEAALGCALPDLPPEPEPWQYYSCNDVILRCEITLRTRGAVVEKFVVGEWRGGYHIAKCCKPITPSEAAQRIGATFVPEAKGERTDA